MTRHHADTCEAKSDHDHDCGTATDLVRLRAFAEMVRDEVHCDGFPTVLAGAEEMGDELRADALAAHRDDCFHCAALMALGQAR